MGKKEIKADEFYMTPGPASAPKEKFKPLEKPILRREVLIAKGICVACQGERSTEYSPLGKQCLYKFSAIEAKMRRGSV